MFVPCLGLRVKPPRPFIYTRPEGFVPRLGSSGLLEEAHLGIIFSPFVWVALWFFTAGTFPGVLRVLLGRAAEHGRSTRSGRDSPGIKLDPASLDSKEATRFPRSHFLNLFVSIYGFLSCFVFGRWRC